MSGQNPNQNYPANGQNPFAPPGAGDGNSSGQANPPPPPNSTPGTGYWYGQPIAGYYVAGQPLVSQYTANQYPAGQSVAGYPTPGQYIGQSNPRVVNWHGRTSEQVNAEQNSQQNAQQNDQSTGNIASDSAPSSAHSNEQTSPSQQQPEESLSPDLHQVIIEFQPPPVQVPVVLRTYRPPNTGVYHGAHDGSNLSLTAVSTAHSAANSPPSPQEPRDPSNIIYLPTTPSPPPSSSTPPPPPPSPTTLLHNINDLIWQEYAHLSTPEALATQASLLSAWNEEASAARVRDAEDEAHVRAVRLESELSALADERERQRRRREIARVSSRNTTITPPTPSTLSLVSDLVDRFRLSIRNRAEDHTQQTPQPSRSHPRPSSSVSASTQPPTTQTLGRSLPPPPFLPTTRTTPPETIAENTCALCSSHPGTLIQGPGNLGEIIPFTCCQGCLDEVLEAEVQARGGRGRE
ncbi:hypothetical protein FQN54_004381 [Arachnomyces sp. PD_36]|nr:hypothetical protein FQN54_004381 [Arachnomyces sp. PD_36]